jgi:hypothetical protein
MASQRPARDIWRRNYALIVNGEDDSPANPPANPPIPASLETVDDAIITKPIPTTDATNTAPPLDDSNIYDDSEDDLLTTLASSIQPSDSMSQVPRVPRLQAKIGSWSWGFDHFIAALLDDYYISKRTRKRTQDHHFQCKQCWHSLLDSKRHGTTNMAEHLKKHIIYQTSLPTLKPQTTIDEMFKRPFATTAPLMSLEQAILEWIVGTLQPFVVVEKHSFQRIFECIQHEPPLRSGDTVRNRIMGQLNSRYSRLKELELASSISLSLDAWTSPNYIPVFAIIGHWIIPNYVK